jgi:hypothetical protein
MSSLWVRGSESNPHGSLGRAIQATTIQIGPRSRRLSSGPSGGKELGGREREGGSRTRNTSRPNSGTSGSSSRPTRTRCTILLRVPKGLRQSFGSPGLVLLGDLRVDGGRLDAGMAELLLDDFQVRAAGPIEVSRIGMATRVRGVPGIQAYGRHEPLDYPPDPVAGEWSALTSEHRRLIRDVLAVVPLPRQEGFQVGFQFLGDEDSRCLPPLPWRTTREARPYPKRQSATRSEAISEARRPEESRVSRRAHDRTAVTASVSVAWRARASAWRRIGPNTSAARGKGGTDRSGLRLTSWFLLA